MSDTILLHITPTIYNPYPNIKITPVAIRIDEFGIEIFDNLSLSPNREMTNKDFLVIHQKLPRNKYEFGVLLPICMPKYEIITVNIVWGIDIPDYNVSMVSFQNIDFNVIQTEKAIRTLLLTTGVGRSPIMLIKERQLSERHLDWIVKDYKYSSIVDNYPDSIYNFKKIDLLDDVRINCNLHQEEKEDFYNDRYVKKLRLPTIFSQI